MLVIKIYIETDLEGISGIVMREQAWDITSKEYLEQGRYYLMREVNAVIEAVYEAGATDVVVNDCHYKGFNMVLEDMDERPEYIQGIPRDNLLYGLDETFDAVLLIGFHAKSGTSPAILDHTFKHDEWMRYWLNGREMGEIGQLSAMAGYYGVPVVFVSGDLAAVNEARELLGSIETVAVKKAFARTCASLIPPKRARRLVQAGVKKALMEIKRFQPFQISLPAEIKVELVSTEVADRFEANGATRIDGRTVQRQVHRIEDIVKF